MILGAILLQPGAYTEVAALLAPADFTLEKNRRIYLRMGDLHTRGEAVDVVTVANELRAQGQLESVDGLSYLSELTTGLPEVLALESYVRIVLDKAARRRLIVASQSAIDRAMNEAEPVQDIATATTESLRVITEPVITEVGRSPEQIIDQFPGGPMAFLDPSQRKRGLPTGFTRLDEMTDGLHPGELVILGARPSHGKTAYAVNICQFLAIHPHNPRPSAIFSLEMNAGSILTRMLCSVARVDQHKFRAGFVGQTERHALQKAMDRIRRCPLTIFDKFGIGMAEISKHIRRLAKDGCQLIVVDYLQLIAPSRRGENRNLEVGDMTRQFKILAGECQIPIMVLSQLSRRNEQRPGAQLRPQLSDLRDSGSIEQDADSVWFIFREELHKAKEELRGVAEILVSKQRNGPVGRVELRFLSGFTTFANKTEDMPADEGQETLTDPEPAAPMPREDW